MTSLPGSRDLPGGADTVFALATPSGRSALAVLRISGPEALSIGCSLAPQLECSRGWRAQLRRLVDARGELLDEAVLIPYRGPSSYSGEDALELIVHGVPAIVRSVMERLLELGARAAVAGELSRRAVANGRMELLEAEALSALFEAGSRAELRAAQRALDGELGALYRTLLDELVELRAELVAVLDFEGQGIDAEPEALGRRRAALLAEIAPLLERGRCRRGVPRMVLAGPPNAGKSTLFNALLGFDRALVSELAGTTRDHLEADLRLGDRELLLIDTAGLGELASSLDRRAQTQTRQQLAEADLVVSIVPMDGEAACLESQAPVLRIVSHADRFAQRERSGLCGSLLDPAFIETVRTALAELVAGLDGCRSGPMPSLRQVEALEGARAAIEAADFDQLEIAAEHLELARRALAEIIGPEDPELVYDRLFARFCLGK